jgi:hypothetical protein
MTAYRVFTVFFNKTNKILAFLTRSCFQKKIIIIIIMIKHQKIVKIKYSQGTNKKGKW